MLPSAVAKLLPTPAVNDMGAGKTPAEWDAWTDRMKTEHGNGNGHGPSLSIEAMRLLPTPTTEPQTGNGHARNLGGEAKLLPTPTVMDHASSGGGYNGQSNVTLTDAVVRGKGMALLPTPMANEGDKAGQNPRNSAGQEYLTHAVHADRWGDYADAIARWANTLGRPAPNPTEPNPKTGRPRLSPRFEEWMMGLPDGWITNTPDVTWKEAVRMCGNGVVPQQSEAAVRWLLNVARAAA